MDAAQVLTYWFDTLEPGDWFGRSDDVDAQIRRQFAECHRAGAAGELYGWRCSPEGRLAEILVLDQFSRNLYRDDARAFACDAAALVLAQEAIAGGVDDSLSGVSRCFLCRLCQRVTADSARVSAFVRAPGKAHEYGLCPPPCGNIERFGRYPHRNAVLGRHSTPEEQFLRQPAPHFRVHAFTNDEPDYVATVLSCCWLLRPGLVIFPTANGRRPGMAVW